MFRRHPWLTLIPVSIISLFLFFAICCSAQSSNSSDNTVFTIVEKQPEFPGGFQALRNYLIKNVQYPPAANAAKVSGRVVVSFIVERDGHLTDPTVLKGLGFGCDEEAIRLINLMPRWTPGTQSGKPIRVKYNLPVLFGTDYPQDYPRHGRH